MVQRIIILIMALFLFPQVYAEEFIYILNDPCIITLYENAEKYFTDTEISVEKDTQGIHLSFEVENPETEYCEISGKTSENLSVIADFLAKIKNPVIIELRLSKFPQKITKGLKFWEVSTVIANNAAAYMQKTDKIADRERILSVGYGEFYPKKNTSNNGGKISSGIDIIIMCNTTGD